MTASDQRTRAEAIQSMERCLAEMVVDPVKTTIPVLRRILASPEFQAGTVDTGFLERTL